MQSKKTLHKRIKRRKYQKGGLDPTSLIIGGVSVGMGWLLMKLIKKLQKKRGMNSREAFALIKREARTSTQNNGGDNGSKTGPRDPDLPDPEDTETAEEIIERKKKIKKNLHDFFTKFKLKSIDEKYPVLNYILSGDIIKQIKAEDANPQSLKCHDFNTGETVVSLFKPEMFDTLAKIDPTNMAILSLDDSTYNKENSLPGDYMHDGFLNQMGGAVTDDVYIKYENIQNVSKTFKGHNLGDYSEMLFNSKIDSGDIVRNLPDMDDNNLKELINDSDSLERNYIPILIPSVIQGKASFGGNCDPYNISYDMGDGTSSCTDDLGGALKVISNYGKMSPGTISGLPADPASGNTTTTGTPATADSAAAATGAAAVASNPAATPDSAAAVDTDETAVINPGPGAADDKIIVGMEVLYWNDDESKWEKGKVESINNGDEKTIKVEGHEEHFVVDSDKYSLIGQGGGDGDLQYVTLDYFGQNMKLPIHNKSPYESSLVEEKILENYDQNYTGKCFIYKFSEQHKASQLTHSNNLLSEITTEIKSQVNGITGDGLDITDTAEVVKAEKLIRLFQLLYYMKFQIRILTGEKFTTGISHTDIMPQDEFTRLTGVDSAKIAKMFKLNDDKVTKKLNSRTAELSGWVAEHVDHKKNYLDIQKEKRTRLLTGGFDKRSKEVDKLLERFGNITQDKLFEKNLRVYSNEPFTTNFHKFIYQIENPNLISPFVPKILFGLHYYIKGCDEVYGNIKETLISSSNKSDGNVYDQLFQRIKELNTKSKRLIYTENESDIFPGALGDGTGEVVEGIPKTTRNTNQLEVYFSHLGPIETKKDDITEFLLTFGLFFVEKKFPKFVGRLDGSVISVLFYLYTAFRYNKEILEIFPMPSKDSRNLNSTDIKDYAIWGEIWNSNNISLYNTNLKALTENPYWIETELGFYNLIMEKESSIFGVELDITINEGDMKTRDSKINKIPKEQSNYILYLLLINYIAYGYLYNSVKKMNPMSFFKEAVVDRHTRDNAISQAPWHKELLVKDRPEPLNHWSQIFGYIVGPSAKWDWKGEGAKGTLASSLRKFIACAPIDDDGTCTYPEDTTTSVGKSIFSNEIARERIEGGVGDGPPVDPVTPISLRPVGSQPTVDRRGADWGKRRQARLAADGPAVSVVGRPVAAEGDRREGGNWLATQQATAGTPRAAAPARGERLAELRRALTPNPRYRAPVGVDPAPETAVSIPQSNCPVWLMERQDDGGEWNAVLISLFGRLDTTIKNIDPSLVDKNLLPAEPFNPPTGADFCSHTRISELFTDVIESATGLGGYDSRLPKYIENINATLSVIYQETARSNQIYRIPALNAFFDRTHIKDEKTSRMTSESPSSRIAMLEGTLDISHVHLILTELSRQETDPDVKDIVPTDFRRSGGTPAAAPGGGGQRIQKGKKNKTRRANKHKRKFRRNKTFSR